MEIGFSLNWRHKTKRQKIQGIELEFDSQNRELLSSTKYEKLQETKLHCFRCWRLEESAGKSSNVLEDYRRLEFLGTQNDTITNKNTWEKVKIGETYNYKCGVCRHNYSIALTNNEVGK